MARTATLLALAATALLLVPAASAHTTIASPDGKVNVVIGLLNEPVVTYGVSGVDICFKQRDAAGTALPSSKVQLGNFSVALTAPNGAQMVSGRDIELAFQSNRTKPGCMQFSAPQVFTLKGQYTVDLAGAINGTSFALTGVKAGGEVRDRAAVTFPDANVPSTRDLDGKIAALQARLDALEAAEASEDAEAESDEGKFAPPASATLLMLGLAGLVALLRRRD